MKTPLFALTGKVAVVTGSSSGIGRAVAERLEHAGATVIGFDRKSGADLERLTLVVDVSDEAQIEAALAGVVKRFGRLDIMVNNAGIQPLGIPIDAITPALLERTLAVNVNGVVWGIKHAARHMKVGARIINTGSFVGAVGVPDAAVYSTSKAAVMHLTKVAALELAPRGITVNSVCPGTTETPAVMNIPDNPEIAFATARTPLKRLATVSEIAAAFHFLASDDSSYLTGVNLPVDGGIQAGWERYDTVAPTEFSDGKWNE
ncbi:MAG: SDR family oxidoreductase [Opitutaceae bacterium]|nr:SDR family oxidoreductase [Opitutaceae bacterium]